MSENIYSFTAEANDNKARFRCEASNIMSQTPLKAEVDLTVMCKYLIIVHDCEGRSANESSKIPN